MKMMMKIRLVFSCFLLLILGVAAADLEKLAIAEPVAKGGVSAAEVEALWGMLESSVGGYEVISRSALKSMMTEIGLVADSGLTELNSNQRARLGELKTARYLLISSVAKFGNSYQLTLMVLDSSTGTIDAKKKVSASYNSLDEISAQLKDLLSQIGLGTAAPKRGISALLTPAIRVGNAPAYLKEEFAVQLESSLLEGGVRLRNLQSVDAILSKNQINALNVVEPAMFRRVGELLQSDYLIQPTITRFSCIEKKEKIAVTKQIVSRRIGNFAGNIRIIAVSDGEVVAVVPFEFKIDFDDLEEETEDWEAEDFGKLLIRRALSKVSAKILEKLK